VRDEELTRHVARKCSDAHLTLVAQFCPSFASPSPTFSTFVASLFLCVTSVCFPFLLSLWVLSESFAVYSALCFALLYFTLPFSLFTFTFTFTGCHTRQRGRVVFDCLPELYYIAELVVFKITYHLQVVTTKYMLVLSRRLIAGTTGLAQ
jgi:hypothetical protein